MSHEVKITTDTFQKEVLEAGLPVLVDFWATWCPPCKMMDPILGQAAADYDGKLIIGKVNTDEEPALAERFGIASIPTMIIFSKGQEKGKKVGAMPRHVLDEFIKGAIA